MADLLDELGKKTSAKGTPATKTPDAPKATKKASNKQSVDIVVAAQSAADEGEAEGSEVDEPTTTASAETDNNEDPFASWTKDQLADALKETRAEAAKRRVEVKDIEQRLQADYESKVKAVEEKFTPLLDKAEKFEKIKAQEEDKKRSLEEKLGHRDVLITQRDEELKGLREELQKSKVEAENRIGQLKANLEAHESYYKDQLDKEKAEIPKKYQDLVETIIKGSGDVKQALDLVRTAKKENLFGEKKVVVNHSVPSAKSGARTDSATAVTDKRSSLKSSDKIRAGLKDAIPQMMANKRTFGL